jgi:hypothetical protein
MSFLIRMMVASGAGLAAFLICGEAWDFVSASSFPTSQYIVDSQRFVEVASTALASAGAFALVMFWRT